MGFSRGSAVKNPPANMGDVGSTPGPERFPLEEEMTPHSCRLAWKIPWTEDEVPLFRTLSICGWVLTN